MNGDEIRRRRSEIAIHTMFPENRIESKLDLILDILEGELDVLTMGIPKEDD